MAVIITYGPVLNDLLILLKSLREQGVESVVVDNCSLSIEAVKSLKGLCQLIQLDKNKGIAAAQNLGVAQAAESGAEYILFFDQDTQIYPGYVDGLIKDFADIARTDPLIASIGPVFTDSRYGFYYKVIQINRFGLRKKINPEKYPSPFSTTLIISSGSMMPLSAFKSIGYMDESLFIDYVDTEWCLRAKEKGYNIYVSTSSRMNHAIGDKMVSILSFNVPVHSPFRRYYRVRNAFFLLRMRHVPKLMAMREIIFNTLHQIILIITQKQRKEYFFSFLKAVRDGVLKR